MTKNHRSFDKCGRDVLDHAVGEHFLLGIAAHIGEGQYRDRRLVGERQGRLRGWRRDFVRPDPIHPDRARDISEVLLAHIREGEIEPAGHVLLNPRGYANPARLGQSLEPCCDIDPIAENVAILDDDVALMDADTQLDAMVCRTVITTIGGLTLDLDCAAERIDDAGELDEQPVAGRLDQPPAMRSDCRVDHLCPDGPQPVEGSFLVNPDQARIAGDIGCQDRGEPTFRATWSLGVHCPTA